jgi:GNAT superfamily N-acetyltransferase
VTNEVTVRRASRDDSAAVTPLLDQLGYPVTPDELAGRFDRVAGAPGDAAWVAIDGSDVIVGFAAGHLFLPFELRSPVAELTALVVDEQRRRGGAGRGLVAAFETWATAAGAVRFSVATAFRRHDAHAFYERLGYQQLARKYEKQPA